MSFAHLDTASELHPQPADDRRVTVLAGFLGWTLDAFDFFLVVFCLTAIARDFHRSDADLALSITATLAFRPVGAFIFGLIADRYGRRLPLMLSLVFFSVMETLSGLAPNYKTFLLLRALFGIGMGGEWGVGASLAMEKVPAGLRGLVSGLLQQGYAIGYLLAALGYYLVFETWGWRPLFFIGGLPALLALFVRYRVKESEVWRRMRHKSWRELGHAILSHWKLFLYLTLLMTTMACVSHGTQDMYPTFLERQRGFGPSGRAAVTAISMIGAIFGGLFFGFFSDRFGRRSAMIAALLTGICVIPIWIFAPSTGLLVTGAILMQFMVQGAWGVIPAHLSELSPDSMRGFLPGFAYQCGVLLASSVAYLEAVFAQRTRYSTAMALTVLIVLFTAAAVTALGREQHGIEFGIKKEELTRS